MNSSIKSKITTITYLAYCILAAYWIATYTGPAKILSDVQISMFGNSWGLLSFLILFFPVYIIFSLIQGWMQNGRLSMLSQESQRQLFRDLPFQNLYPSVVVLLATILMGSIMGGHAFDPDLGVVDLSQIESGTVPHDKYYAQVSGYPTNNEYLTQRKGSSIPNIYIPLNSKKDGNLTTHLIVLVQENEMAQYIKNDYSDKKITVSGYIDYVIEGKVKAAFEDRGVKLAPNVRSLVARVTVGGRGTAKNFFFGMVTSGIAFAIYLFIRDNKF
jgi:hypothetical protein